VSKYLKIEVFGCDGSYWCISGEGAPVNNGANAGVTLSPRIKGGIDAPVKSLWLPGTYGQQFVTFRWQRRDVTFAVQTFVEDTGDEDADAETWMSIDWAWRAAWDYVKETRVRFTTSAGPRDLYLRMVEEPKAYETNDYEGFDPFLTREASCVMTCAAELPFYVGEPLIYDFELSDEFDYGYGAFPINVDCDVPVWGRYTLTDQATWTLADFSWGSNEYGKGIEHSGRTITLPHLEPGEGSVVDSDPRVQTILAANKAPVQSRWRGNDMLYPFAPGAKANLPIAVKDVTNGAMARLTIPRWYTRPWSRPLP
jgi:hypothetical protein